MNNSNSIWIPCKNGHIFPLDSRRINIDRTAEGTPCFCGQTTAHWEKCPTCGHEKLVVMLVSQGKEAKK